MVVFSVSRIDLFPGFVLGMVSGIIPWTGIHWFIVHGFVLFLEEYCSQILDIRDFFIVAAKIAGTSLVWARGAVVGDMFQYVCGCLYALIGRTDLIDLISAVDFRKRTLDLIMWMWLSRTLDLMKRMCLWLCISSILSQQLALWIKLQVVSVWSGPEFPNYRTIAIVLVSVSFTVFAVGRPRRDPDTSASELHTEHCLSRLRPGWEIDKKRQEQSYSCFQEGIRDFVIACTARALWGSRLLCKQNRTRRAREPMH
eukprot:Hpha_TRINITY_DN1929_c0_g1::TRINITY_DN1929_c0_g1_i1::g.31031::m.31031